MQGRGVGARAVFIVITLVVFPLLLLAAAALQQLPSSPHPAPVHDASPPADMVPQSSATDLATVLSGLEPGLASVLKAIADSVTTIAESLRSVDFDYAGSVNSFGDSQLQADLHADEVIFSQLRACPAVASASSEEQTNVLPLSPNGAYTVAFDPLDGSSIVDANFAVGSIFGVWRGATPVGQTGRQQVAAAYALYGPKTLLVVAVPSGGAHEASEGAAAAATPPSSRCSSPGGGSSASGACGEREQQRRQQQQGDVWDGYDVLQFTHVRGTYLLKEPTVQIRARPVVAPANLKAAGENGAYKQLLDGWIAAGYKLRYSGGMVPDVHHILAKGGGVFCNPVSPSAPAKLRLLYECAPLAFVMEAAGGASSNGQTSILDVPIASTAATTPVVLGSRAQVTACLPALAAQGAMDSSDPGSDPSDDTTAAVHGAGAAAAAPMQLA